MPFNSSRILLVDSYDSFTHNLACLCKQSIPDCCIHIIRNDDLSLEKLLSVLPYFSAVIVGPGPGSPANPEDVGIIKDLWHITEEYLLPVFGVCLGLQSLAVEFASRLKRLPVVKHGQISVIQHEGTELFKGVGEVRAVRYHSLCVDLPKDGEVEKLAWADDGPENGEVIMSIKHKTRPFWAVQYHPESVCTEGGGSEVLRNFWRLATNWSGNHGRSARPWKQAVASVIGNPWPSFPASLPRSLTEGSQTAQSYPLKVSTRVMNTLELSSVEICELLGVKTDGCPFILLDSASQPGRFSIIGALHPSSPRFVYYIGDTFITIHESGGSRQERMDPQYVWSYFTSFMRARRAQGGSPEVPFWGGLLGYLSYELGVASSNVSTSQVDEDEVRRHPDVNLVFVERSVILDSLTSKVYIQSIIPHDEKWIDSTASLLTKTTHKASTDIAPKRRRIDMSSAIVTLPDKEAYISRINQAKEYLYSGDSYELCLTAQTRVTVPKPDATDGTSSWELFKTLRKNNPAPHSAYIRLAPTTLLSSSPERFLSFTRPPGTVCQLRPIKGTVRKAPGITRAVAEKALAGNVKELAENLMIVDLIRHDLHGVVGEDVQVSQFCKVEEYETVWQLVSVIEGSAAQTPEGTSSLDSSGELGWQVLSRSLPPGSMTGAPKKRSVEILQTLEDTKRSVYSGCLGYWCVGGSGDWSVIIRSCFKHDDPVHSLDGVDEAETDVSPETEEWIIGAGGAITALSDPVDEWEEMLVKLESALRAFGVSSGT